MRQERSPFCHDDTADCVGPSVLAPQVPPLGTHPCCLRRCKPRRWGLRRSAVKSSAAPLRYKTPFDVRSHVWSSSGCCCLLCGDISSVQIHPFFHFHVNFIYLFLDGERDLYFLPCTTRNHKGLVSANVRIQTFIVYEFIWIESQLLLLLLS